MARKKIKKVSVAPINPITGSIVDSTNIADKTTNTYSAEIIDGLLGGTSWKNATLNSSYVSSGSIRYTQIGKLVIVEVNDLVIKTTTEQITVLGTGLPRSAGTSGLLQQFSSGTVKRVVLNGGEIKTWYDPITASDNAFFGLFVYFIS